MSHNHWMLPVLLLCSLLLFVASCDDASDSLDGDVIDGDTDRVTDGDSSEIETPDGDSTDADTADGDATESDTSDGDTSDGDQLDGDLPDGDLPDGDSTDGDTDLPFQEHPFCLQLGEPTRRFKAAVDDATLLADAADFTLPTTEGDWNLREHWTGCESYLFIPDVPKQTLTWPIEIWERDTERLFELLPNNVHVFFMTYRSTQEDIDAKLADLKIKVDAVLAGMTTEQQTHWQSHIHYVNQHCRDVGGWLGEIMTSPRWGAGIDRFQRVRYIGSFADHSRYDANKSWFAPNLAMAANEAIYYNFEATRDQAMQAEQATVVPIFDNVEISDTGWAGTRGSAVVQLPDAASMANFDTLSLDLTLDCVGVGEYGTCPPWDYLVYLYLCDADDPTTCNIEFGRWITTYHREGRWVHDVSSLLPLLGEGGERRFEFYSTQLYNVSLSLRFSNQTKAARPMETVALFTGGDFSAAYNDKYDPISIDIPADAVKVELASVISGHGMSEPGNCAEFCNTTHHFFVNGHEYMRDFPYIGDDEGCMKQVAVGAVPNQYGTWWYGRSGWCPGMEVPVEVFDITDQVTLGASNNFDYQGFYNDAPYTGSGANIRLQSWLVISK